MTDDSTAPAHLLVVDDDAKLRALLARYLGKQWVVTTARHVKDAEAKLAYFTYDLMVLDVMMPGESGLDFAARFCKAHSTPILMLTAMGESDDRIAGLEAGVDDYLAKPFEPRELVLRIERILARTRPAQAASALTHFGDYALDINARRLMLADEPVHLTESEMTALCLLAQHMDTAVSREQLALSMATPGEAPNPRSTDVLITRLRRKIEAEPSKPLYLQTVRGEGYILRR